MTDTNDASLDQLLERLRFRLREPVAFSRTDTETTLAKVRLLTAAATYFNVLAVSEFGGRLGPIREAGLVEQVVAAAFQSFGGEDPHPGPFDKAAMLLRGITQGHPFHDGNKRTGFLTAMYYLDRVGFVPRRGLKRAEVVDFCQRVSSGERRDVDAITAVLEGWFQPRS